MTKHTDSDAEMIRRVLQGDVNAFEPLLKKYKRYVFKIVNKHVPYDQAEEVAQDVFVRAYQSLANFKAKSSFRQWLAKIAVRTCYDFWRKRYKNREISESALSREQKNWLETVVSEQSDVSFYEEMSRTEAREVLNQALDRLSPEDRMVLELVYMEGRSGKEVAELLGWSLANVKIRTYRSRKKLHKWLTQAMEA